MHGGDGMELVRYLGFAVLGYVCGSFPSGAVWTRLIKGIDVRRYGSGRTGSTNVWRAAGLSIALLTGFTDALKGAVAVWLVRALGADVLGESLAGAASVLGHNHSLFLGFQGGAGTAPNIGAAGAMWLPAVPILVVAGFLGGWLTGHASIVSIVVAVVQPLIFALRGEWTRVLAFGLPALALVLYALRPNLQRLKERRERFIPAYEKKVPPILLSKHPLKER